MAVNAVQILSNTGERNAAIVDGSDLYICEGISSIYDAAQLAIAQQAPLEDLLSNSAGTNRLSYDDVYYGRSAWRLLTPVDHPGDPAHCLVTGTGLTHRKSADNRNAMHATAAAGSETDSMKMYRWGEEGGRPESGCIGTPPEWFYKGDGSILRAHGEPISSPGFAEDGGEEAEVAGIYVIGLDAAVYRVGFTLANEFSDHVAESRNYLYLAPSKLRECAIGPEIRIGSGFDYATGHAEIVRENSVIWRQELATGEPAMVHTLANLEHHHFKYKLNRKPGDVHVHFFGTPGFSFGSGLRLLDGDLMTVHFDGYGRALTNILRDETKEIGLCCVKPL